MVQCKKKKINYKLKKVIDSPQKDWIIVQNTHEAIIDKALFLKAQELIRVKQKTRNKSVDYLLRGLVYCQECGKKMGTTTDTRKSKASSKHTTTTIDTIGIEGNCIMAKTNSNNHAQVSEGGINNHTTETKSTRYLRCSSYATAPLQRICTPHLINYEKLEKAVITEVKWACKKYLKSKSCESTDKSNNSSNSKTKTGFKNQELDLETQLKKEKAILSKAIEVLETQIDKIYDDKLSGLISNQDFSRIYDKKIFERDEKLKKLKELENTETLRSNFSFEKSVLEFLKSTDITSANLTSLIDKIEINNAKKICINYKFIHSSFMS